MKFNRPMEETMTFTKYVGGSPANITIGMSRLGMKTAFIGKIANDQMGRFIADYLQRNGIDTSNVVTDRTGAVTGLAFTEIKSPTDCSILMYRDNVADLKLTPDEVQESLIAGANAADFRHGAGAKPFTRSGVPGTELCQEAWDSHRFRSRLSSLYMDITGRNGDLL